MKSLHLIIRCSISKRNFIFFNSKTNVFFPKILLLIKDMFFVKVIFWLWVESLVHLGILIEKNKFVEDFFCQKFRNVEKSFYSLYGLGCRPDDTHFAKSADIYKKFCHSSFYYGLETNYISETTLKKLNIRQSIMLKNSFG